MVARAMKGRRVRPWLVLVLWLLVACLVGAFTSEFDDVSVGFGGNAAVSADGLGSSVVVWEGDDGDGTGILGQRFDTVGVPLGTRFRVNSVVAGDQVEPDVAYLSNGGFVVVWEREDDGEPAVVGQCFDTLGMPLGAEFLVNTKNTGVAPSVDSDAFGNFTVAWTRGKEKDGEVTYKRRVQRFDRLGLPVGAFFTFGRKTPTPTPTQIAVTPSGIALVTWQSRNQNIRGQLLDAHGVPVGSPFRINEKTRGDHRSPSVSYTPTDDFVVVWERELNGERTVRTRTVANMGFPVGAAFQVSEVPFDGPAMPGVATDPHGNSVVTWECTDSGSPNHGDVFLRRLGNSGEPVGSEFQVNQTAGLHADPEVSASVNPADFVVVWHREDASGEQVLRQDVDLP